MVWSLNATENVFAHAASTDLVYWGRQSYPQTPAGSNVSEPVITSAPDGKYAVRWQSNINHTSQVFSWQPTLKPFPQPKSLAPENM
ncbi:hypothetical protein KRR40_14550 [Niabella defluvii]|nr:hypothetical protein KRR40_14550 [Niabella sp. I65]